MARTSEEYNKALEIISRKGGELSDDTYLDKLLDCTKQNLSSTSQLHEWGILPFVKNAFIESTPGALKAFALRLCCCVVCRLPDELLPLLQLVPHSIYRPNHETGVLAATAHFLRHVFEATCEAFLVDIGQFCVKVNIWDSFLKPIMVENVGKSFHLTKVVENLAVSLIKVLGRALEVKSNEVVSNDVIVDFSKIIDGIMDDLWISTDTTSEMACRFKPLLRILEDVEVNKTLLKLERSHELTKNLLESVKCRTSSQNLTYSVSKDILELLVYLMEDFNSLIELFKTILSSGNYPDCLVKAAIFVSLKHHKRFKNLGTFFLDKVDQDCVLAYCVFTVSVLNALELFKCDDICIHVVQGRAASQLDQDGKDLTGGMEENLYRNLLMFLKNWLECNSSHSSSILSYQEPVIRVLRRFLGVSDALKSDALIFLSALIKRTEQCENLSSTVQVVLRHASSSSWDVKDSALSCIASILSVENLVKMMDLEDCEKIKNVLKVAKKDSNSFIRAAAFRTFAVFIKNIDADDLDHSELIDDFRICLDSDTEAIARREAVKLVQSFYLKHVKVGDRDDNIKSVENLMIKTLFDFDWEVKVNVVKFWKAAMRLIISQKDRDEVLQNFGDHGCLTAIVVAMDDYENLVASEAKDLVEVTKQFIDSEVECKRRKMDDSVEARMCTEDREEMEEVHYSQVGDVIDSFINRKCEDLIKDLPENENEKIRVTSKSHRMSSEDREEMEEVHYSQVGDVIDSIINRKCEDLIKDLPEEGSTDVNLKNENEKIRLTSKSSVRHISPEIFVSYLAGFDGRATGTQKDPSCKFSGILSDIIESARGAGLVDDIDCY